MKRWLAISLMFVCLSVGYGLGKQAIVMQAATPAPASAPSSQAIVKKDFEKRFDRYDDKEKAQIRKRNSDVFARLAERSEFEKAAALNHFIYNEIVRKHNATANSALEVLASGEAVCGGMVMALAEMLYAEGIHSSLAYVRGGKGAAHSMLQVNFSDGEKGLFDPYHGVLYYDAQQKKPLGLAAVKEYITDHKRPVFYASKNGSEDYRGFASGYSEADTLGRVDYAFPDLFTDADGAGVAYSGFIDVVNITLAPGALLGTRDWQPSDREPNPWTRLGQWREGDKYLSWALTLGQSMGYDIRHAYQLKALVPGKRYRLEMDIANAYLRPYPLNDRPALTVQQVYPSPEGIAEGTYQFLFDIKGYKPGAAYEPQHVEVEFTATATDMTFLATPNANLVLSALELKAL